MLVLVVAFAGLRASTSWQQVAGVALVAGGIVFVRGFQHGMKRGGVPLGLVIGCCIAGYTLIDKYGIRYATPVSYLELSMVAPTLALRGRGRYEKGVGCTPDRDEPRIRGGRPRHVRRLCARARRPQVCLGGLGRSSP